MTTIREAIDKELADYRRYLGEGKQTVAQGLTCYWSIELYQAEKIVDGMKKIDKELADFMLGEGGRQTLVDKL